MKKFPELKTGQVALSRADVNTGHMLDDKFDLVINDIQNVYSVFDSLEEGQSIAKQIMSGRKDIECIIHGEGEILLAYLNPFKK